mmetsp:Transcript_30619/g.44752  ORF Transcript_30619/g.44752 Transcript_30619/m.44752 type:complete len:126 (+) Transcript_30619:3-380(+)
MVFVHVSMLHFGSGMSPSMQDSIAQLGAFVGATTARPPPPPEYPGYDPVFKSHYPKFYGSLTGATKPGQGTTYLGNDTPNLMGSLSQDCTRAGAPAYCYGVTRATMVKEGWGTSNAAASTKRIFG